MKAKIKVNWSLLFVILLAIIFFVSTASFNFLTQEPNYVKWTSPDETANYIFAQRFSEGKSIAWFNESAIIGDNMVMPRSVRSDFGWLKPVSFLGIILIYGTLGSFFGTALIPFLTPIIAALGIIIFYLLMSKIFSRRIGVISAALLSFFPVYIYYAVRSMFHNVLFTVLLLIAAYFIVLAGQKYKKKKVVEAGEKEKRELLEDGEEIAQSTKEAINDDKKKYRFFTLYLSRDKWFKMALSFLGGLFFGLTVITRISELIWLVPTAFIAWLLYVKRFSITKLILIIAGFFLAILPNIYFNQLLYSAPIYGGYNEMNRSIDDITQASSGIVQSVISGGEIMSYLKLIYNNVFYFGFDFDQSVDMAINYIWQMFPFLSIAFLLGVLITIIINIYRPQKKYLVYYSIFIVLSLILIFYYGSWQFNDNPDPNRYTIGNSYTRYWLPIYLMMIPIASLAIYRFSRALALSFKDSLSARRKKIIVGIQVIIISIFAFISIDFVLYGSEEGLVHLYYNNLREKTVTEKVFSLTEDDAIIITKYYDKFLFPERHVIMGNIQNQEILTASKKLVNYYPVYYYNFYLNEADVSYLNERKLPEYNLSLKLIKRISHDFGLYSLEKSISEELVEEGIEDVENLEIDVDNN